MEKVLLSAKQAAELSLEKVMNGLKTKSLNRSVNQPRGVEANCIGEFLIRS